MTPGSLDELRKAFADHDAAPGQPPGAVDAADNRLKQALWASRDDIKALVRAMEGKAKLSSTHDQGADDVKS